MTPSPDTSRPAIFAPGRSCEAAPLPASAERLRGLLRDAEAAKAAIGQNDLTEKRRGPKPGAAAILSGGDPKRRAAIKDQMHRDRKHVALAKQHPIYRSPRGGAA